jgi:ATP-dependent Clp protease ATP-binding subunit ClpA
VFERFTRNAQQVVAAARADATAAAAPELRPVHLLTALAQRDDVLAMKVLAGLGAPGDEVRRVVAGLGQRYAVAMDADDAEALKLLGIDLDDVIRRIDRDLGGAPSRGGARTRFSAEGKKVLEMAVRSAQGLGDGFFGTEHLLVGLINAGDRTTLEALKAFDLDADDVRRAVAEADRRAG